MKIPKKKFSFVVMPWVSFCNKGSIKKIDSKDISNQAYEDGYVDRWREKETLYVMGQEQCFTFVFLFFFVVVVVDAVSVCLALLIDLTFFVFSLGGLIVRQHATTPCKNPQNACLHRRIVQVWIVQCVRTNRTR